MNLEYTDFEEVKRMRVCIDPGHGGKDPGAIGKNNTREKDITLAIAKKFKIHIGRWYKCQSDFDKRI